MSSILDQGTLGIGTWYLGENPHNREQELACLQYAIEAGISILDTAEMYGEGLAESLLGQAIKPYDRDKLYLVSKVLPQHANQRDLEQSLDGSLKRLGTDYLDLYLYHWRGETELEETIEMLTRMQEKNKIKAWGVSNFDLEDMQELASLSLGQACQVNQVLYHLGSRGIEYALKPYQDQQGIVTMAYCPLAQAGLLQKELLTHPTVIEVADGLGISVYQVLLSFVLSQSNMVAIPRTSQLNHMKDNLDCRELTLPKPLRDALELAFPKPSKRLPLDTE
ncbi:aldo/keto reductase [Vaginisenegalia massiliensis]|uniref:aldo/keto reductase n=1 Tax=Vaginisenegalia massiliensis TaxID=2058294 RepID=UPI000F5222AE|nr:aldo/keto reductase [Vaginisenegalia massiliensis]